MSRPRYKPRPKFTCKQCGVRKVWSEFTLCSHCQAAGVKDRNIPRSNQRGPIPF